MSFAVKISISVGDGAFNDEGAVVELVVVSGDLELVVRDAVVWVFTIENVLEVATNEGVFGAIDMP